MVAPEHHPKVDTAVFQQEQDGPPNTFTTPFSLTNCSCLHFHGVLAHPGYLDKPFASGASYPDYIRKSHSADLRRYVRWSTVPSNIFPFFLWWRVVVLVASPIRLLAKNEIEKWILGGRSRSVPSVVRWRRDLRDQGRSSCLLVQFA